MFKTIKAMFSSLFFDRNYVDPALEDAKKNTAKLKKKEQEKKKVQPKKKAKK